MKNKRYKIIFTGGGTAGHVVPAIPLIKYFKKAGWDVFYFGSKKGIENQIVKRLDIPLYRITTGKIKRYFSLDNFFTPFKVFLGIIQSFFYLERIRPDIVFSKGGYVSFPVVIAAWLYKIPIIIHESDFSPGLANKLSYPFAKKICLTFYDTTKYFRKKDSIVVTGTPIREEILQGEKDIAKSFVGFDQEDNRVLLIMGGSRGSMILNDFVRDNLDDLRKQFNIIHLCGKGNLDMKLSQVSGYRQLEYVEVELPHILALADIVLSRAGANTIFELIATKTPHVLVPLSSRVSRGEQILNAKYFNKLYGSKIVFEENIANSLLAEIHNLNVDSDRYRNKLNNAKFKVANNEIIEMITDLTKDQ